MKKETIVLGSDHAGFKLKEYVKGIVLKKKHKVEDLGSYDEERVDYPDYAEKVALAVARGKNKKGILCCATGIGISISANKIPGVRAALVRTPLDAKMSRAHNDANILVLGGRPFNRNKVKRILNVWLKTKFAGGRHKRRVNKIIKLDKKYSKKL